MEASEVIQEILKFHDDIGAKILISPNVEDMQKGIDAAGVIRVLLERIGDRLIHKDETRERFNNAISEHFKVSGNRLLYERDLDLND